jgi:hypothetical protein
MTPEDRQALWVNLPEVHKKIDGSNRLVLVTRLEGRVWVPLRELTIAEFCYLKSFAWAQAWKKKREVRDRIEREKAKKR